MFSSEQELLWTISTIIPRAGTPYEAAELIVKTLEKKYGIDLKGQVRARSLRPK